ncbi:MAG: extracellular solute-binding protein [Ruminococcaceae bacterium]|nr:extracellular solute-binding protein [Oscillospiraceae bacterium]
MKKQFCLILAALLLTGCGADAGTTDTTAASTEETTTEEVTTIPAPDLPDKDFGGENINFLVRGEKAQPTNFSHEIYASEENGDAINDAVYRRNMAVQERFNVEITETAEDDSVDAVKKSVLADDGAYDVVMVRPNRMVTLGSDGMLADLYEVPHIDTSKQWWDQNGVANLTFNGKLYFINGDINIMDNNAIWALMFNKDLFDKYQLEYPYESVKDGTWTLDKFVELAKFGSEDLDGNGIMDEFDQYGLITANENIYPLIVASDNQITSREGNEIVIDPDIEGIHAALDKIIALTSDSSVTLYAEAYQNKGYTNVWSEVMRQSFKEGRGLMYISGILSTTYLRDMNDEFGIIPLPKASESQKEYKTWMSLNNSSMLGIPSSNDDLEMTGIICEALAAESAVTLTPAYFDTTLSGKVARDEDSVAMLEIILGSVSFDFANIFNLGSINGIFPKGGMTGNNTFASDYASREAAIQKDFEKVLANYGTK